MSPIRVLVVDDSAFMRTVLVDLMSSYTGIEVVGQARNGAQALNLVTKLEPSVVLMDIEMPVMDGLTTLVRIMAIKPTPVIIFSGQAKKNADVALKAMRLGAVDYFPKPETMLELEEKGEDLIVKIVQAAKTDIRKIVSKLPSTNFPNVQAVYRGHWSLHWRPPCII